MTCEICGKDGVQIRRVSRSYGHGADLFVIENIPIVSRPHCGESYLTAATLHEIERIKLHRRSWAQDERSLLPPSPECPVASFALSLGWLISFTYRRLIANPALPLPHAASRRGPRCRRSAGRAEDQREP